MSLKIKLWGVRGSLPSPILPDVLLWRVEEILTQYQKLIDAKVPISPQTFIDTLPIHLTSGYGGNTSCAEVTCGDDRLIIDAGSGIRGFSDYIMKTAPTTSDFHIYFTHYHWDHLIGLPFFTPLYLKGRTVHFYSVDDELERSLRTLFRKPNFPVPFEVVSKQIKTHKLSPREPAKVGSIQFTPYELDHPDPCWGIRIEAAGKTVAWAVDHEGQRHSPEQLGADMALFRNVDLMVYDAQYTFDEALEKINWGHSSAPIGIDLAIREQIKQAIFVHHDPAANDEQIRHAEEQTSHYYEDLLKQRKRGGLDAPNLQWRFGREGEVLEP